jgi:hypothetical protein
VYTVVINGFILPRIAAIAVIRVKDVGVIWEKESWNFVFFPATISSIVIYKPLSLSMCSAP